MDVTFRAHASFRLETPEMCVVTDLYTPGVPGSVPIDEPADLVIMRSGRDPSSGLFYRRQAGVAMRTLPLGPCAE
jgi:hypothetical protein